MSDKNNFYITTTLPYVNSKPHVGFALEIIRADIIARHKESLGFKVLLNTGTDEHGAKIFQKAEEDGIEIQQYVDEKAQVFKDLLPKLGIRKDTVFIRTTEQGHVAAAQKFWEVCDLNGDIYKKLYAIKYCVGCELEKTDSELIDGECPLHPGVKVEIREEENYFFKFSNYQDKLLEFYKKHTDFVVPQNRFHEIKTFVESGLQDFSISRLKEKMPWGVPVPGDAEHVMYVWFDALVNYVSTIGWPDTMGKFKSWWPVTQYCGKDNLRQQSAMWQAMLMSAGLEPSKQIVINGFITSGGQKMSKSIGNVIDPFEVVERFGTDALRYYVARELSPFEDSDMTIEKFHEAYTANLVNGMGNLTSRIMKMAEDNLTEPVLIQDYVMPDTYKKSFEEFTIQKTADSIWEKIKKCDESIQITEPFKLIKTDPEKAREIISNLVQELYVIACMVEPIMPKTTEKIKKAVQENKKPENPIFERIT